MLSKEYTNRIDWTTVVVGLAGFLLCLVLGIATNSAFGLALGLVFGSVFFSAALCREFLHRPTIVRIEPGGFRMYWRGRRSRFFRWESVKWIFVNPGKSDHPIRKYDRGAMLKMDHVFPYALTYDLAQAIMQGCYEETGGYPPSYHAVQRAGNP